MLRCLIDVCTANEPRPTNGRPEYRAKRLTGRVIFQANINKSDGRRGLALFVLILCAAMLHVVPPGAARGADGSTDGADFVVAPDGNDAWSGRLAAPDAQRTDGPFASLERARDAVRQLRSRQKVDRPIIVRLRAGVYPRVKPLVFGPEDSGTPTSPVIYESWPGQRAVISGGRAITGWKAAEQGLWRADVPEAKSGAWQFRQLFVNGQRRFRPRLPKEGFVTVAGGPQLDAGAVGEDKTPLDLRAFRFRPGDIRADWANLEDVEIVVLQFWTEARLRIQKIDEKGSSVLFTGGNWRPLTWSGGYYAENVREALDTPGAWYLDHKQGVLYYHPLPGEDMAKIGVIAPAADQVVRIEGDDKSGRVVRNLVLRRLAFEHTNWALPPGGYRCEQSEITLPAAIQADGAVDCRIEQCELAHLGCWGVELKRGCRDNAVMANLIEDAGAGGVKIGEPENAALDADETCRTTVSDNRICDCGREFLGSSGVWVGQSSGNTVSHNDISGPLVWAVSVGWTWSYFPLQRARDNVVEFNHCHHLGTGPLGSHCAIYALGTSPGTAIRNNRVHHLSASSFWTGAGEGIILDNGCCGILVENNLVYDAVAGGFGTNFNCFGNIIQNNIFAYGRDYQLTVYGDPPSGKSQPKGEVFARNIVLWREGPLIKENDWPAFSTLWDYNLYWHEGGSPVSFMRYTFDQWKSKDLDVHSLVADPGFVDPAHGDFTLRPDSPALKLGFRPIDVSNVGPRKKPGL